MMRNFYRLSIPLFTLMIMGFLNSMLIAQTNSNSHPVDKKNPNIMQSNSAIENPNTGKPEEYLTAFWYAMCNGELKEISKGKIKKSAVIMAGAKVITRVDINAFNTAIHYNSQACSNSKPSQEFFFIQLSPEGKISQDSPDGNSNPSMVPTCWNIRNLRDYVNTCNDRNLANSNKPGTCRPVNLCNCTILKQTYSCQTNACPQMFSICH